MCFAEALRALFNIDVDLVVDPSLSTTTTTNTATTTTTTTDDNRIPSTLGSFFLVVCPLCLADAPRALLSNCVRSRVYRVLWVTTATTSVATSPFTLLLSWMLHDF